MPVEGPSQMVDFELEVVSNTQASGMLNAQSKSCIVLAARHGWGWQPVNGGSWTFVACSGVKTSDVGRSPCQHVASQQNKVLVRHLDGCRQLISCVHTFSKRRCVCICQLHMHLPNLLQSAHASPKST